MTTFDDLCDYELGDEVVLFEAPRQNPKNSFKTGTVGKISEFYADGFLVKTNYGECIRTYLPFVCKKEEDKKYYVYKRSGHYYTIDTKPVYEKVMFEGTEKECYEFVEKELENV